MHQTLHSGPRVTVGCILFPELHTVPRYILYACILGAAYGTGTAYGSSLNNVRKLYATYDNRYSILYATT